MSKNLTHIPVNIPAVPSASLTNASKSVQYYLVQYHHDHRLENSPTDIKVQNDECDLSDRPTCMGTARLCPLSLHLRDAVSITEMQ